MEGHRTSTRCSQRVRGQLESLSNAILLAATESARPTEHPDLDDNRDDEDDDLRRRLLGKSNRAAAAEVAKRRRLFLETLMRRSLLRFGVQDVSGAQADINEACRIDPHAASVMLTQSILLLRDGQNDAALRKLDNIIHEFKDGTRPFTGMGDLFVYRRLLLCRSVCYIFTHDFLHAMEDLIENLSLSGHLVSYELQRREIEDEKAGLAAKVSLEDVILPIVAHAASDKKAIAAAKGRGGPSSLGAAPAARRRSSAARRPSALTRRASRTGSTTSIQDAIDGDATEVHAGGINADEEDWDQLDRFIIWLIEAVSERSEQINETDPLSRSDASTFIRELRRHYAGRDRPPPLNQGSRRTSVWLSSSTTDNGDTVNCEGGDGPERDAIERACDWLIGEGDRMASAASRSDGTMGAANPQAVAMWNKALRLATLIGATQTADHSRRRIDAATRLAGDTIDALKSQAASPHNVIRWIAEAKFAYIDGKWSEAVALLDLAIAADATQKDYPSLVQHFQNKACCLVRANRLDAALDAFSTAEALARKSCDYSSFIEVLNLHGEVLIAEGRFADAQVVIARCVREHRVLFKEGGETVRSDSELQRFLDACSRTYVVASGLFVASHSGSAAMEWLERAKMFSVRDAFVNRVAPLPRPIGSGAASSFVSDGRTHGDGHRLVTWLDCTIDDITNGMLSHHAALYSLGMTPTGPAILLCLPERPVVVARLEPVDMLTRIDFDWIARTLYAASNYYHGGEKGGALQQFADTNAVRQAWTLLQAVRASLFPPVVLNALQQFLKDDREHRDAKRSSGSQFTEKRYKLIMSLPFHLWSLPWSFIDVIQLCDERRDRAPALTAEDVDGRRVPPPPAVGPGVFPVFRSVQTSPQVATTAASASSAQGAAESHTNHSGKDKKAWFWEIDIQSPLSHHVDCVTAHTMRDFLFNAEAAQDTAIRNARAFMEDQRQLRRADQQRLEQNPMEATTRGTMEGEQRRVRALIQVVVSNLGFFVEDDTVGEDDGADEGGAIGGGNLFADASMIPDGSTRLPNFSARNGSGNSDKKSSTVVRRPKLRDTIAEANLGEADTIVLRVPFFDHVLPRLRRSPNLNASSTQASPPASPSGRAVEWLGIYRDIRANLAEKQLSVPVVVPPPSGADDAHDDDGNADDDDDNGDESTNHKDSGSDDSGDEDEPSRPHVTADDQGIIVLVDRRNRSRYDRFYYMSRRRQCLTASDILHSTTWRLKSGCVVVLDLILPPYQPDQGALPVGVHRLVRSFMGAEASIVVVIVTQCLPLPVEEAPSVDEAASAAAGGQRRGTTVKPPASGGGGGGGAAERRVMLRQQRRDAMFVAQRREFVEDLLGRRAAAAVAEPPPSVVDVVLAAVHAVAERSPSFARCVSLFM